MKMDLLKLGVVPLAALMAGCGGKARKGENRPNIIVIMNETLADMPEIWGGRDPDARNRPFGGRRFASDERTLYFGYQYSQSFCYVDGDVSLAGRGVYITGRCSDVD